MGTLLHLFWQIKGDDSCVHSGLSAPLSYRDSDQECKQCRNKRGDCLEICNTTEWSEMRHSQKWSLTCRVLARAKAWAGWRWDDSPQSQLMEQFRCKSSRQKASDLQTSQVYEREVDTWINISHNVQWIKLPGKSDPFTVVELGNQWLRFWIFFLLFSSSVSEFPEMLNKDTNWDQDFGTKMELLFLFVSGNITLAKSFS